MLAPFIFFILSDDIPYRIHAVPFPRVKLRAVPLAQPILYVRPQVNNVLLLRPRMVKRASYMVYRFIAQGQVYCGLAGLIVAVDTAFSVAFRPIRSA